MAHHVGPVETEKRRKFLAQGSRQGGHVREIGDPAEVDPVPELLDAERGLTKTGDDVSEFAPVQPDEIPWRTCHSAQVWLMAP